MPISKKVKPHDYAQLLQRIQKRPDFHLIQTVILRSMAQAQYQPVNAGHFGLALNDYTHFTSPIRRYPDLLVHRAIQHILAGGKAADYIYTSNAMQALGQHCSKTERRADEAVRDATDSLKCEYMEHKLGETFNGIINGVTAFGVFVELENIYIEGLVHVTSLPNDYYQFDAITHKLIGERTGREFQLGDRLKVIVSSVNIAERKIDFMLAEKKTVRKQRQSY